MDNNEKQTARSGNIWGWRNSFISLGIILLTLVAVLVFDDPPKESKYNNKMAPDSLQHTQVDSLKRNKK